MSKMDCFLSTVESLCLQASLSLEETLRILHHSPEVRRALGWEAFPNPPGQLLPNPFLRISLINQYNPSPVSSLCLITRPTA